jgi:hypothetical protein
MRKKTGQGKSKLRLELETLRQLRDEQLAEAGGAGATPTIGLVPFWTTGGVAATGEHCQTTSDNPDDTT